MWPCRDGMEYTIDGRHHNVMDPQILECFDGIRSLMFVHNAYLYKEMYEFLDMSSRTLEHLDVYIDEGAFDGPQIQLNESRQMLPRLKRLFIGSTWEHHIDLEDEFFICYPDLEVFRCYGDARVYTSPEFFENLADHRNIREIRLNTLRELCMERKSTPSVFPNKSSTRTWSAQKSTRTRSKGAVNLEC